MGPQCFRTAAAAVAATTTIIIIITIIEAEVDRPLLPVYTTLNDNKLFIILKHTLQHIKDIRIRAHTLMMVAI